MTQEQLDEMIASDKGMTVEEMRGEEDIICACRAGIGKVFRHVAPEAALMIEGYLPIMTAHIKELSEDERKIARCITEECIEAHERLRLPCEDERQFLKALG